VIERRYGESLDDLGFEVDFWADRYAEELWWEHIDDAIEEIIDNAHPEPVGEMGEIEVCGFVVNDGGEFTQVASVTVPVVPWVREHRPDWIEDDGAMGRQST
jgi:hypothetical protein